MTGSGKSSILRTLQARPMFQDWLSGGRVVPEEETFGEVMGELAGDADPERIARRLTAVLDEIAAAAAGRRFVLERFHHSYDAVDPVRNRYGGFDERLAGLMTGVVLLSYDPARARERALNRSDRAGTDWKASMVAAWGSEQGVLDAVRISMERREAFCTAGRLPVLRLDTGEGACERHADGIMRWAQIG